MSINASPARSWDSLPSRLSSLRPSAIGGSINYVNKQPTGGPVRNEIDASVDSFGSFRTHLGSGGNTGVQGLDYRFEQVVNQLAKWRTLLRVVVDRTHRCANRLQIR